MTGTGGSPPGDGHRGHSRRLSSGRRGRRPSVALGVLMIVVVGVGTACGAEPEPVDFGVDNRDAFLAGCTASTEDSRLVRDICECAYEEIRASYDLAELAAVEESLKLDAFAPLPPIVVSVLADCLVSEADL